MPDVLPGRTDPPRRSGVRAAGWLAAGLLIAVFVYSPVTDVLEPTLDASNYASYAYFTAHHFQYGTEVVPMYGPLGFILPGTAYAGELFWARLAGQLVASAAFAAVLLGFFHRARATPLRWLALGVTLALAPLIDDMPAELTILLGGLLLLAAGRPARWLPVAGLFAFLSLIKGTHLLLALATLGVVAGFHVWQRRGRFALGLVTAYGAVFLALWAATGQAWAHLPAFLAGILALSSGYNAAMGLAEPAGVLARGLLALGLLAGGLAWGAWPRRREPAAVAGALLFAGFTFVVWKHGFVRADGHIGIFHQFVIIAAVLWPVFAAGFPAPGRRGAVILMVAAMGAGAWIESPVFGPGQWRRLVGARQWERWPANLSQLLHPGRTRAELEARLGRQRDAYALRLIGEEIGSRPVDLFGVRQGVIALNGFVYRPRPMGGGSFNVYNRYLMRLNREFLRDPARRPSNYLLRLEPIDERLGPQEDGLTLLELIARYHPVRLEDHYLLLQETIGAPGPELVPLAQQTFLFGETVAVPAVAPDRLLVARFGLPSTLSGRVREFFYKPPVVAIALQTAAGTVLERRLVPAMARSPFLFSPTLDDTEDFLRLFATEPGKAVTGFTLRTAAPWAFARQGAVEFFTIARPPVARAPGADELLDPGAASLFNVTPESIVAPDPRPLYLGRLQVQPLHAPGRVAWALTGDERELVFEHGLMPETWVRGHGNGVVFIVDLEAPDRPPQQLFARLVDPFSQPADRRTLRSRVAIPPHLPGSRLVLRTDPGPYGDTAWDWAYVTHVLLQRGLAAGASPAIFARIPAALAGNAPVLTELAGRPVALCHVPATVAFARTGADRRVRLEFGFLPGAYSGEGRTGGADIIVELAEPGGASREIFRRTLRPVPEAADRGPQAAVILLPPPAAAGERIVVRTAPAPGADNSWGWTYISRCDIE